MNFRKLHAAPALAAVLLAACAARPANPVPLSRPGDEALSCEDMAREMERNRKAATGLAGAEDDVVSGNIAAGVVGVALFWPALFAMDLSNAEQIELRALNDRNDALRRRAARKGCGG